MWALSALQPELLTEHRYPGGWPLEAARPPPGQAEQSKDASCYTLLAMEAHCKAKPPLPPTPGAEGDWPGWGQEKQVGFNTWIARKSPLGKARGQSQSVPCVPEVLDSRRAPASPHRPARHRQEDERVKRMRAVLGGRDPDQMAQVTSQTLLTPNGVHGGVEASEEIQGRPQGQDWGDKGRRETGSVACFHMGNRIQY